MNDAIDSHDDFRFRDAAEAIHFKYRKMGMIHDPNGTVLENKPERVVRDRPQNAVRSQACSIL